MISWVFFRFTMPLAVENANSRNLWPSENTLCRFETVGVEQDTSVLATTRPIGLSIDEH